MKHFAISLALAAPVFAGPGAKEPVATGGDWQWSISAGAAYRNVGQLKTNTGYRSGGVMVPSFVGGPSLTEPNIGDENAIGDREYNDGYVRQDAATAIDSSTWYWGYSSGGQVQGDQLVYSATGAQSILRDAYNTPNGGPYSKDSLRGVAPRIQVDLRTPYQTGGFRWGMSGAFEFTQVDHSMAFSNYNGNQFRDDYRLDYEDRYDLNGVVPPLAPYSGTFGGPGPIIGNIPTSRSINPVLIFTDTAGISNQVWTSIDIDVFSFTFGPSLSRQLGPIDLSIQAGVIFNIYSWEGRQSERLQAKNAAGTTTVAQWNEGDSSTKFRPGLYAQLDAFYDVGNNWSVGAYSRIDTAAEFRAQAGPTIFKIDPSGYSAGFMVRYTLP